MYNLLIKGLFLSDLKTQLANLEQKLLQMAMEEKIRHWNEIF